MNPLFALFAPLALLLPSAAGDGARDAVRSFDGAEAAGLPTAEQVRIEQRVIIRVAPRSPINRPSMFAQPVSQAVDFESLTERKMGRCVPVSSIAAAQPAANRLLFYLRDRRLVAAELDKKCSPREFYSGFYLERTGDGMLCADRDKIQSRAGANCGVRKLRELIPGD